MSREQDESERQERGDLLRASQKGQRRKNEWDFISFSGIYFPQSRNLRARISFFLALISLFWQAWVSFEPEEAGREKWECWFLFPALFTSFDVYYTTVNEGAYQKPTPASNELSLVGRLRRLWWKERPRKGLLTFYSLFSFEFLRTIKLHNTHLSHVARPVYVLLALFFSLRLIVGFSWTDRVDDTA